MGVLMGRLNKKSAFFLIALAGIAVSATGKAQDVDDPEFYAEPTSGYVVFDLKSAESSTTVWKRPEDLRWAYIYGCGGGGAGAKADSKNGSGGSAAIVSIHLVYLAADSYRITIGQGGKAGASDGNDEDGVFAGSNGGATKFEGIDTVDPVSLIFLGGAGSREPAAGNPEFGADSAVGSGGRPAIETPVPFAAMQGERCAGGGGSWVGDDKNPKNKAGNGGHGLLAIIPAGDPLIAFGGPDPVDNTQQKN